MSDPCAEVLGNHGKGSTGCFYKDTERKVVIAPNILSEVAPGQLVNRLCPSSLV